MKKGIYLEGQDTPVFECYTDFELEEFFEYYAEHERHNYIVRDIHNCRGTNCDSTNTQERSDFHGISTGHYCDDCYENNYPYRRDDYTHGTGVCDDGTPIDYNY